MWVIVKTSESQGYTGDGWTGEPDGVRRYGSKEEAEKVIAQHGMQATVAEWDDDDNDTDGAA